MSITETTTRVSYQWLMRKSKSELAAIVLYNLHRIDLLSEACSTLPIMVEIAKAAEKATDDAWVQILDAIWQEARGGKEFENWALAASARRALQKLRAVE